VTLNECMGAEGERKSGIVAGSLAWMTFPNSSSQKSKQHGPFLPDAASIVGGKMDEKSGSHSFSNPSLSSIYITYTRVNKSLLDRLTRILGS